MSEIVSIIVLTFLLFFAYKYFGRMMDNQHREDLYISLFKTAKIKKLAEKESIDLAKTLKEDIAFQKAINHPSFESKLDEAININEKDMEVKK